MSLTLFLCQFSFFLLAFSLLIVCWIPCTAPRGGAEAPGSSGISESSTHFLLAASPCCSKNSFNLAFLISQAKFMLFKAPSSMVPIAMSTLSHS